MISKNLKLSNGIDMPAIGLGTWQQREPETVKMVIYQALVLGYRLIDTATAYRNEEAIGEALAYAFSNPELGLAREDIWITSKLSPAQQGFEGTINAVNESLAKLQTNYIDLYLIHWPGVSKRKPESPDHRVYREESWRALEKLYRQGKVRAIGVSNYTIRHLDEMKEYAKVLPMVNQCEMHPLCPQLELRKYCKEHGIAFTAYASLGEGKLLDDKRTKPQIEKIVKDRTGISPVQALLLWGLQHAAAVIPKASNKERLAENIAVLEMELSEGELRILDCVATGSDCHFCWFAEHIA